ncbi:MAG: TetR/AcrR family transcriptional regulator [Sandaracinaceae bacterium]
MRPKDADSAVTYDAIVRAALDVLSEGGDLEQLSLRRVGARAGVSLGAIQYYFVNKDSLLEACLDDYYVRLSAEARALVAEALRDPASGMVIERAARRLYRFVRREATLTQLRVSTNARRGELHTERQAEYLGALIQEAAQSLIPRGMDEVDLRLTIQGMASMIVRLALLSNAEVEQLTGLDETEARARVETFVVRAAHRLVGVTTSEGPPG